MEAKTIRKSAALREQVVDVVLTELRNGDISPGTRITEEGLARRFGVSRTPIREALGQLTRQGTLYARPGGGYVVPSPSVEEVRQTVAVRLMLEPQAVQMAAEEYGREEVRRITKAIRKAEDAIPRVQPAAFISALEDFRCALFSGIANRMLSKLIAEFGGHMHFIRAMTLKDSDLRKRVVAQQVEIRDAIKDHDGDRAQALWVAYIGQSEELLRRACREPARAPGDSALPVANRMPAGARRADPRKRADRVTRKTGSRAESGSLRRVLSDRA
jgi:DNA-binding GntR family transcriptional regulator